MSRQKKNRKFDFVTLLLSVLAGLLWAFLGRILIQLFYLRMWTPLLIGLYFLGLALILILVTWVCTVIKGRLMPERNSYPKAFALALAIFVLAGLFQWIYSRDFQIHDAPTRDTSLIFLVDDSGSMMQNDPNVVRVSAIKDLLAGCDPDFPYAVYAFTQDIRLVSLIQPASEAASNPMKMNSYGLTNIADAIAYVANDIESGVLEAGARPHIILITDGRPEGKSNHTLSDAIQCARKVNARISTVGVGDEIDQSYLTDIAIKTGGNCVTCATMSELLSGMTNVTKLETTTNYQRTLLNKRESVQPEWLYSAMRILFLLILAVPFMLIKTLLLRTNDVEANVLVPNLVLTLIGALSVEIAMNQYLLQLFNEPVVHSILCIGFTILIVTELTRNAGRTDDWDDRVSGFSNRTDSKRFQANDDDFD